MRGGVARKRQVATNQTALTRTELGAPLVAAARRAAAARSYTSGVSKRRLDVRTQPNETRRLEHTGLHTCVSMRVFV